MAKNKRSKILAMALCAGVMAGIYASPVMAADIKVEEGSTLNGVATSNSTDYTITSGTLKLDGADIANALNGKNINLGTGSLIINNQNIGNSVAAIRRVVNKDTGMSATYLEETVKAHSAFGLQVLDEDGKAVATISRNGTGEFNGPLTANKSLTALDVDSQAKSVLGVSGVQLYNSDGTNKVNITNSGVSRFGSFDETNVRIEGGALKIMAPNNEPDAAVSGPLVAQLSEDGLTLVDADRKYSTLTAAQLANLNSTIKEGGVVDANELNVEGTYGSLHVKDVANEAGEQNTMIYVEDKDGNDTLYIDPATGNLVTKGALSAGDGAFVANKNGIAVGEKFSVSAENGGVQAVEYKINDANVFNASGLTASAGNVGGVEIANGEVDGVDVSVLETQFNTTNAKVAGIKRNDGDLPYGEGRTEIEGVVAVNGKDGRFYVLGENGTQAAVITNDGTARFGFENEKHVRLEDGALKINDADKNTVASLSDEGLTLGAENLDEAQLNNINNVIQEGGNVVANSVNVGDGAVMANSDGSFSAANNAFKVDTNGTLTISNAAFPLEDKTVIGAGYIDIGATHIDGFGIETDYIEAGRGNIGGVSIVNGEVDGVDISDLNTTVTSNLSGIDRIDSDNDGDLDTTIIEGALSANTSTVNMFGDTGLDFTYGQVPNGEAGVNVTGNMHFMSGADVTFNYDGTKYENKSYSLNDLVDGINDLNGRVDVLEEKTQGISYDEETGTTTVDGNLNVEGDATTGEGGNLNAGAGNFDKVSTDEITVGDKTYIDGDSVNSVEGNFENITADKGNIGGVGLEGGTVTADKVVTGNTTLDNEGLNVGGQTSVTADGVNVGGNGGTTVSKDGVSIADKTIISDHDVVINEGTADRVSLSETADRVSNLEQGVSELNNRVGELEDRIDKVGAMAAAIANLRTMGYDPAAPTEVAVGVGQYRDETGMALGLFHYPNRDFMLSLSVSTSGDEYMGGIGATWKFGRKSPEKVAEIKKAQAEADARRAEEQKLAKAEEMKKAAKEAKVQAQMERHAKLAAERAALEEA